MASPKGPQSPTSNQGVSPAQQPLKVTSPTMQSTITQPVKIASSMVMANQLDAPPVALKFNANQFLSNNLMANNPMGPLGKGPLTNNGPTTSKLKPIEKIQPVTIMSNIPQVQVKPLPTPHIKHFATMKQFSAPTLKLEQPSLKTRVPEGAPLLPSQCRESKIERVSNLVGPTGAVVLSVGTNAVEAAKAPAAEQVKMGDLVARNKLHTLIQKPGLSLRMDMSTSARPPLRISLMGNVHVPILHGSKDSGDRPSAAQSAVGGKLAYYPESSTPDRTDSKGDPLPASTAEAEILAALGEVELRHNPEACTGEVKIVPESEEPLEILTQPMPELEKGE